MRSREVPQAGESGLQCAIPLIPLAGEGARATPYVLLLHSVAAVELAELSTVGGHHSPSIGRDAGGENYGCKPT